MIARDPVQGKKLVGDLTGSYSCRLTYKHRIVYSIDVKNRVIYVERAATHYGESEMLPRSQRAFGAPRKNRNKNEGK